MGKGVVLLDLKEKVLCPLLTSIAGYNHPGQFSPSVKPSRFGESVEKVSDWSYGRHQMKQIICIFFQWGFRSATIEVALTILTGSGTILLALPDLSAALDTTDCGIFLTIWCQVSSVCWPTKWPYQCLIPVSESLRSG